MGIDRDHELDEMLAVKDWKGIVLKDALAETLKAAPAPLRAGKPGFTVASYVEAHIEQGPILEREKKTIGVVTTIQGSRRFVVEVTGEDGHAGTVTRARRKDAMFAATDMVQALRKHFMDDDDRIRFTVGRFVVEPNAMAVIPGKVTFTIDFRHPEEKVLIELGDGVEPLVQSLKGPCEVKVTQFMRSQPVPFTGLLPELIQSAADRLGLSSMPILSGAGHDSIYLAKVCPTAMIFVPCKDGLSHTPLEDAKPEDAAVAVEQAVDSVLAAGARTVNFGQILPIGIAHDSSWLAPICHC